MPIYEFTCEECEENFEKLVYLFIGKMDGTHEGSRGDLSGN